MSRVDEESNRNTVVHTLCKFLYISTLVSSGGENSFEAVAGVCGVLRIQCATADPSHHLCGHEERY